MGLLVSGRFRVPDQHLCGLQDQQILSYILAMTAKAHECPTCRCTNYTDAQAWADKHLIHTGDTQDTVLTQAAFTSYLRWFRQTEQARAFYTQNKLTRWLRESGCRVELISGHNRLIGYRLAS